jgi:hypothetical protein
MSAAAAPTTPSRFRGSILPGASVTPPPRPRPGTDQAALTELRNAAATYDFLRRKGDPAEFWEMLRLARSRRAIIAPAEGEAPAPAPEVEAGIVHEVESMRRQFAPLVRDLRRYLKNVSGLPEPFDRLEMALAFLLASGREHQAVSKWLAEPGKHAAKAAEKLRSLADITDSYREALQPWTLQASAVPEPAPPMPEVSFSEIEEAPPASPPPRAPEPSIDPKHLELLSRAVECREILCAVHLNTELWEMMTVAATNPEITRTLLERLAKDLEGDLRQQARADGLAIKALHQGAADLRGMYGEWVGSLRAFLAGQKLAPEDPKAFDVGLGMLLTTPGAQDRLGSWLEDPANWQEEVLGLLLPWIRRAQDYLGALK